MDDTIQLATKYKSFLQAIVMSIVSSPFAVLQIELQTLVAKPDKQDLDFTCPDWNLFVQRNACPSPCLNVKNLASKYWVLVVHTEIKV